MQNRVLILGGQGYIGSRVCDKLYTAEVDCQSIDLGWFGMGQTNVHNLQADFSKLDSKLIQSYKTVILLAGHSSVSMCDEDPSGSYRNNINHFVELMGKLLPEQRFIYASSASVYGASAYDWSPFMEHATLPPPIKNYDRQKQTIDAIASHSGKNFYGLRFGTVCGFSYSPRNELMINSMTLSALQERCIEVSNADAYRSILGINDLCSAILQIVNFPLDAPGLYNVCSFNSTIGGIAAEVASLYQAELKGEDWGSTYSFQMDTEKFQQTFNFKFQDTVESIATGAANNANYARTRTETGIRYVI